jgi:DNA-directed RNA polymerase specialized sigma24 family protein
MRQLPRAHREVLLLHVMGCLQREMADVLGKPLKSMSGRIRRAQLALKKSMEEKNHEES